MKSLPGSPLRVHIRVVRARLPPSQIITHSELLCSFSWTICDGQEDRQQSMEEKQERGHVCDALQLVLTGNKAKKQKQCN